MGLNWANSMKGSAMGVYNNNGLKLETGLKLPWDRSDGA